MRISYWCGVVMLAWSLFLWHCPCGHHGETDNSSSQPHTTHSKQTTIQSDVPFGLHEHKSTISCLQRAYRTYPTLSSGRRHRWQALFHVIGNWKTCLIVIQLKLTPNFFCMAGTLFPLAVLSPITLVSYSARSF